MKITIFGGSFDPPHLGHHSIAKNSLEFSDHFIFIPVKQSPHKFTKPIATETHRMNMLKLMIENIKNTEIDTFELENNSPSYTWHTVQHIKAKFQDSTIIMVIGGDLVSKLHTWHNIDELSLEISFLCFPRDDNNQNYSENFDIEFVSNFKNDISSTTIRELIADGKIDLTRKMLHPVVFNYISWEGLYQ